MRSVQRRGRKHVDPNESSEDRFKRLARNRLSKALECMRLIQNLSRRTHYDYTEREARKIVRALAKGVEAVEAAFERGGREPGIFDSDDRMRRPTRGKDSGRFRDTRSPRQRLLDRNKQGARFWPRRMGPGPR